MGPGAQERGNMKHILFASSEAVPFIKTGGLADVAGSLPGYFPKSDYDVRVVIPKYLCMDESVSGRLELVAECQVQLNWRTQYAGIYQLEENGITYYFIDNEYYFAGPAPYGQILSGRGEVRVFFQGGADGSAGYRFPPGCDPLPRLADPV